MLSTETLAATVIVIAAASTGLKFRLPKCSPQFPQAMLSSNQRLGLVLSVVWLVLLGVGLVIGGVVWWNQTSGAAAETSLLGWLALLALCGAIGGYLRTLAHYIIGLHSGINLARWSCQSVAITVLGAVAGILAASLAYMVAMSFFEIGSVRWLALCALAGVVGGLAWSPVLRSGPSVVSSLRPEK